MVMPNKKNIIQSSIEQFQKVWLPFIILGVGFVVAWTNTQNRLDAAIKTIDEIRADRKEEQKFRTDVLVAVNTLNINVAEIQKDVERVVGKIDKAALQTQVRNYSTYNSYTIKPTVVRTVNNYDVKQDQSDRGIADLVNPVVDPIIK